MSLAPGTRVDAYIVERLIGQGGMGEVYEARDDRLERSVALKVLAGHLANETAARQRFVLEARTAASLSHPHIVSIYEADDVGGTAYVAMQLVDGRDLDALLARDGPLDPRQALQLLAGIGEALDAAHQRGIVHRDVKPANILVGEGAAGLHGYLCDFGMVKVRSAGSSLTRPGDMLGTVDYMAPEAIVGPEVDRRADVYALACVLYACVAGRPPYDGKSEIETLWAHVNAAPPRLPGAAAHAAALEAVIARGMSKAPDDRFATAGELVAAAVRSLDPGASGSVGTTDRTSYRRRDSHSSPARAEPLIGRAHDLTTAVHLVEDHRLVTIVGPGGVGKTRIAREIMRELDASFAGRVGWVGLESVDDPADVASVMEPEITAAGASGAGDSPGRRLLVLDNAEHLLGAADTILWTIGETPGLHVLVTSREPLRVDGEHVLVLEPLAADEAERLFSLRAVAHDASFTPDQQTAQICARLDGLPLALELAAARVHVLGSHDLLKRLNRRLPVLVGDRRDAPARHRTLEATIAWSHDLLTDAERTALCRLTIFLGGWSAEAAERVAGVDLDLLTALLDKSVIRRLRGLAHARFTMLESIREFAAARLGASEREALGAYHATFYLELAEEADTLLDRAAGPGILTRLAEDSGNLRAALSWTRANDPDRHVRLVVALGRFWYERAALAEAATWTEPILAGRAGLSVPLRIGIIRNAERFLVTRDAFREAVALSRERLDLARQIGDEAQAALALNNLATFTDKLGDPDAALGFWEASVATFRALDDPRVRLPLSNLANSLLAAGQYEAARTLHDEVLALERDEGDDVGIAVSLVSISGLDLAAGDLVIAHEHIREGLEIVTRDGLDRMLPGLLDRLAATMAMSNRLREAIVINRAVDMERERTGAPRDAEERELRSSIDVTIAGLPAEATAAAEALGATLTLEAITASYLASGSVGPG